MADPIIKWAGGKGRMLEHILPFVPPDLPIVEPFAGGAALTLHLERAGSALSDACWPLMNTYEELKRHPGAVMHWLCALVQDVSKEAYYIHRDAFNAMVDQPLSVEQRIEHAARFIYLNKAGFNGLWRVNKAGKYNVPWGQRTKISIAFENLERVSKVLQGITLGYSPMPRGVQFLPRDAFWYLDPPYFNTFSEHVKTGFTKADHYLLASQLQTFAAEGTPWLLSHSDDPLYRELYPEERFEIREVAVRRSIAAKAKARGMAKELLIRPRVS